MGIRADVAPRRSHPGADPDFAASRLQLESPIASRWRTHLLRMDRKFIDPQFMGETMEHIHTATTAVVEAHSHATMRWSAIIGGWLVATGIASLLYGAGLPIGLP